MPLFRLRIFDAKTLTFSNISVITEDIYLKLRVLFTIKRGTHTSRGDNPPIFLTKVCPYFDLEFSKCSYSRALAPACGALVKIWEEKHPLITK